MAAHPVNLGVRFLLEMSALAALSYWAWSEFDGIVMFVLIVALPVTAGATWGIFAVPNDPSRSGSAPVPVSGKIRLLIEVTLFVLATVALANTTLTMLAYLLPAAVLIHYAVSWDRVVWLWSRH